MISNYTTIWERVYENFGLDVVLHTFSWAALMTGWFFEKEKTTRPLRARLVDVLNIST